MGPQANNVIDAKKLVKRNSAKARVESLVRLETPPDTLGLSLSLQTTLDLQEMLGLLLQEVSNHLPVDGVSFRSADHGVLVQLGEHGRHRAGYGLRLFEEPLGELSFSRNQPFSEQDLAVIEHLLVPLLYPLRNALRYRAALAASFRDPLTGINNRAAMEEVLPREVERALRHDSPLCMLVIDLDFFKKINDSHGHSVGDCVLRNTAKTIQEGLRTSDMLFRYGGEEFVILLPATDIDGAGIVGERIRQSLEKSVIYCDGIRLQVTASIGAASLEEGDNQHLLFDKADRAVYRAKNSGRNQVLRYEA